MNTKNASEDFPLKNTVEQLGEAAKHVPGHLLMEAQSIIHQAHVELEQLIEKNREHVPQPPLTRDQQIVNARIKVIILSRRSRANSTSDALGSMSYGE